MAGAVAVYLDLAARHLGEAGLWAMLGDAERVSGDLVTGATALAKAAALAPDDTEFAIEWALALSEAGDAEAALEALNVHALDDSPIALAVLADAFRQAGHTNDAVAPYKLLLDLEPRNVNARISLGVCLQDTGDVNGAIACYEAALALARRRRADIFFNAQPQRPPERAEPGAISVTHGRTAAVGRCAGRARQRAALAPDDAWVH